MWCDFHLHSHHSDGEFAPARVVDIVADAGIGAMALTDHDTTAGIAEGAERAAQRGIAFVPGIEMTTYASGQVIHLLGLGIRPGDAALDAANAVVARVWSANQRRWFDSLAAAGFDVGVERDLADAPQRLPVLIERLVKRGVDDGDPVRCYRRFKDFFAALPSSSYAALPSPAAAAGVIRAAGGVAILAHPERLRGDGLAGALLAGLDGLEAHYAAYDARTRATLAEIGAAQRKLLSCGSDYHGYFNGAYVNPRFEAPAELLARLGV